MKPVHWLIWPRLHKRWRLACGRRTANLFGPERVLMEFAREFHASGRANKRRCRDCLREWARHRAKGGGALRASVVDRLAL